MDLMEMRLKDLITNAQIRTGHLLSAAQVADLEKSADVKPGHIKARKDGALGIVMAEISGVRGYPFLIAHQDEDEKENGTVAAYFACELFRPF